MQLDVAWSLPPQPFAVAERKGRAHPDTLCDALAEAVSGSYSRYCLEHHGYILNHNCDKLGLLGGRVELEFGAGRFLAPLRVLLTGRFSQCFGDAPVPYLELAEAAIRQTLTERLRHFDPQQDLAILDLTHNNPSPGLVGSPEAPTSRRFYFSPRGPEDLAYLQTLKANDTSLGVAHAPLSLAERAALELEGWLTRPFLGGDVKILAFEDESSLDLTVAVPFLAPETPSLEFYQESLAQLHAQATDFLQKFGKPVRLRFNARDRLELREIYLTLTGSSCEMGDEGLVGRGNRCNGVICNTRPISMEGASGKNPLFHVGKVYNVAAQTIAERLYERLQREATVHVASQTGRPLLDPWRVLVNLGGPAGDRKAVETIVAEVLAEIPALSQAVVQGQWTTF